MGDYFVIGKNEEDNAKYLGRNEGGAHLLTQGWDTLCCLLMLSLRLTQGCKTAAPRK